jgi:ornithine cyclodeaminase
MNYLSGNKVHELLSMTEALKLSEEAFMIHANGLLKQPPREILNGNDGSMMGVMPLFISDGPYQGFGLKSVVVNFSQNIKKTASHKGVILVYEDSNDSDFSLVDAGSITELRTAAASAFATNILAPQDANNLAILGTGLQARAHLKAMKAVRNIKRIRIWGRDMSKAQEFCQWAFDTMGDRVEVFDHPTGAVSGADLICTTTASKVPILNEGDVSKGAHVNAIGASALGYRELDMNLFKDAILFTDCNRAVISASSSINDAVKEGILSPTNVGTEIGSIIKADWQRPSNTITIFKSVGLAVQDIVFAKYLLRKDMDNNYL